MGNIAGEAQIKEATIEAVIIRADGTREDLGVIARMEDGTVTFGQRLKQAWREGRSEGLKQRKP